MVSKNGLLKGGAAQDRRHQIVRAILQQAEGVATLGRNEEFVYLGTEENGLLSVQRAKGSGWVEKLLIRKGL